MLSIKPLVWNSSEWKQAADKLGSKRHPHVYAKHTKKPAGTLHAERFNVSIPEHILEDLRQRLTRTRWAGDYGNADWSYGTEQGYLTELVRYWAKDFNWRAQEKAINAFSHYRVNFDGVPIHFIHEKGQGPHPIPLVLTHGWPWTFWDLHKVIRPLTHPAEFGGNPNDAFDVVVPSVPGFGFSTPLKQTGVNFMRTADLWVRLMEGLGYSRFGAQGSDIGSFVSSQLGHRYPEHVIGIHLTFPMPLDANTNPQSIPPPEAYGLDEQQALSRTVNFLRDGTGYVGIQSTRPQTLAYAMHDSPAGMCAWFLEKRRAWSDCDGDVEKVFSKDELLTAMTLFWATESFDSATRFYYETAHHPWEPSHLGPRVVDVPTGVSIMPRDVVQMPRSWAEQYYDLRSWNVLPAGGHFAHMEQPERLVQDIRDFFRPLRDQGR
ncbi:MAG TPA: epoxide hydrolase [Archangium sp.]|nr:epoxide hydrolase [Archangium sp.]